LSGADKERLAKNYTQNTEAYQLYLRGRFYWNKRTIKDLRKSIDYFQQAITVDQDYALAYAGLSDSYSILSFFGGGAPRELMPKARDAALKALSLDDQLSEAHAALAQVLSNYDYDHAAAELELKRAIQLNPNYPSAHQFYGWLLTRQGRHEDAAVELQRALELDPFSLIINKFYGDSFLYARRYDEALTQLKKAVELDGNFAATHASLGIVYQLKGDYAASVEEYAKFLELSDFMEFAAIIRKDFTRGGWEAFLKAISGEQRPPSLSAQLAAAAFFTALGENDKALADLNKIYEDRGTYAGHIKVDPRLDPLRNDPRFKDLLKRLNLPE
ncbi:MAG: tetratricopeptide repeat protein, partial [Pyrinomonadaceae bacterium]